MWSLRFGASVELGGVEFRVWAPRLRSPQILVCEDSPKVYPMLAAEGGEFAALVPGLHAGADYFLVTDGGRRLPDPVSRWQPHGVHGPSRVIDPGAFGWADGDWRGLPLTDYVIYELHTGTFTAEGTFEAAVTRLPMLRDLGITAIELMPVAEFPGRRNWGYDGVGMYAPQSGYGGPGGLKVLVNECHRLGLAVVLDVVYNHVGPEGNYLAEFGPYFTGAYRTPWGDAINYDGADSDGVRRFFIENALYWLTEYHIDALRLDAIHGIFDFGARHVLAELADNFHEQAAQLGRKAWLIAESDLNDTRVIRPHEQGGHNVDAQWLDDFHHALHSAITHDRRGYFADFEGIPSLARAVSEGFVYDGGHSAYRRRRHGSPSTDLPGDRFVAFTENHDQVANARSGCRPSQHLSLEQQKLAAAILFFSPYIPLLFMGQEYGEIGGFYYFTDHGDAALAAAVTEGRRREAGDFLAGCEFADPQDPRTFDRSKLNWRLCEEPLHADVLAWYRDWIHLRKLHAPLSNFRKDLVRTSFDGARGWLAIERGDPSGDRALLVCNFAKETQVISLPFREAAWGLRLFSGDAKPEISNAFEIELAGGGVALYLKAKEAGSGNP
jgi:maltooligosyltrehalose trehalohydrolase